jgi:iron(III) transport system permease protein
LLLAFCLAALGLTVLYPSLRLLVSAVAGWEAEILSTPSGVAAVRNTVLISFGSVLTSGLLGTGLALLLTRFSFPGGRILGGVAYLPFTLPPLVGVVSFYYLIGRDGLLPRVLEHVFGLEHAYLEGPAAILAVHTYSFYVFFYAMVSSALQELDVSQTEAARTLGAGRWMVFRRVTFPMLKPALAGASLLTFMSSGASFSAPLIFGGDFPMLSVRVYEEQQQFHTQAAVTLTVVLALVSLLGIVLFRSRPQPSGAGTKGVRRPLRSRRSRFTAGMLAWGAILLLIAPHLAILYLSFVNHREWHEPF